MARGNPNPSPDTRFGGANANPSGAGKSKGQRKAEIEAAEKAAILRAKMISELLEKYDSAEMDLSELIDPSVLKLFKDSEDRAHGTAKQSVDHTNSDGSMNKPTKVELVAPKTDDNSAD